MTDPPLSYSRTQFDYQQISLEISTLQAADDVLKQANALTQRASRTDVTQAAQYYLSAAHYLETQDPPKSIHAYHNAGQQLHWRNSRKPDKHFSMPGRLRSKRQRQCPPGRINVTCNISPCEPIRGPTIHSPKPESWMLQKRHT